MKSVLPFFALVLTIWGCNPEKSPHQKLKLKGSESMHSVFMDLKENFEKSQPHIQLEIEGGGSRTGLEAIKENQADIGLSSFAFDLERELGTNHGILEKTVAFDGIVLITNEHNPLDSLTDDQIERIYEGSIYDWGQLGGNPGNIIPITRDENSGTQRFFTDHFAIEKLSSTAVVSDENKEILNRVQGNINAIGFIGFAYFTQGVHELKLATEDSNGYRSPTKRNLQNNSYPLKRGLRVYYRNSNNEAVNQFINYLETTEAQTIIESYGLIANH